MLSTYIFCIVIFALFSLLEGAPKYLTAYSDPKTLNIKSSRARKSRSEVFPDGIVFKANLTEVVLEFSRLHFEKDCDKHHIDLYDGADDSFPHLKRVCWNGSQSTVVSTGDRLFLIYTVRDRNSWFRVKYSSQLQGLKYVAAILCTIASVAILILAAFCYLKSSPRAQNNMSNSDTMSLNSGANFEIEISL